MWFCTGNKHYCNICFSSLVRLSRIDRVFGRSDVRLSVITAAQQQQYCSESGEKKEKTNLKLAKPGGAKIKRNLNLAEIASNKVAKAEKRLN